MTLTLNNLPASFSQILHRFHIMVFSVLVLGALIVAIFLLNQVLAKSDQNNGYVAQGTNASFDTTTINKLNTLRTINDPSIPLDLSSGRLNPFVEQ